MTRRIASVGIVVAIAALHAVDVRAMLPDAWRVPYASYFSDVAIPCAFYFLLVTQEPKWSRLLDSWMKALLVFVASAAAEAAQAMGFAVLGRTPDLLDVVMYATGVLLAILVDRMLLPPARVDGL